MISKSKVFTIRLGTNAYDLRTHKFKNAFGILVEMCESALLIIFLSARLPFAGGISDGGLTPSTDTGKVCTA